MNTEGISLFGAGFIGGKFAEAYDDVVVVERSAKYSPTTNILYMRSTIHNYHPQELDFHQDIETNLMDFASVLSSNHGRDIVFNLVSTYFVYGNTTVPAREETPCNPLGFYNVTAYAREQLLKTYCMMFPNVKYRIMRLGNVIGIDDPKASQKKNVLQWMIKKMARGEEVTITADVVRDYIDVRDCVRAIRLVIDKGEYNTTYNIANGKGIRLSTLVEEANRELGYRAKVNYAGTSNQGVFLPPAFYLDTTKIKKLGYIQQHDITVSVREIAQYYAKKEKQEEQEEANTKNAENTNSSNSGISENSRNT